MAINQQTLALLVLAQKYAGNMVSQANFQSVLAKMLPIKKGNGQNVAFVAKGTGMGVDKGYVEGSAPTNIGSNTQQKALLNWAEYRSTFQVSGLAQATSGTSGVDGPDANVELWIMNMEDACRALSSAINVDLYTGSGVGLLILGLDSAVGTIDNVYAGIDRSTSPLFNPGVFNSAGPAAAITFAQIRSDMSAIYKACGERPDVIMVSPDTLAKLAGLFDPQKLYQFDSNVSYVKEVRTQRGKFDLEGGVGGIRFDGAVMVEDKDCPDNAMYYLNTRHVRIETLPMNLSNIPGASDEVMEYLGQDEFGPLPFGFQVEMLAKSLDADTATMKSYLQLCVDRPNTCGKRLNIL